MRHTSRQVRRPNLRSRNSTTPPTKNGLPISENPPKTPQEPKPSISHNPIQPERVFRKRVPSKHFCQDSTRVGDPPISVPRRRRGPQRGQCAPLAARGAPIGEFSTPTLTIVVGHQSSVTRLISMWTAGVLRWSELVLGVGKMWELVWLLEVLYVVWRFGFWGISLLGSIDVCFGIGILLVVIPVV